MVVPHHVHSNLSSLPYRGRRGQPGASISVYVYLCVFHFHCALIDIIRAKPVYTFKEGERASFHILTGPCFEIPCLRFSKSMALAV